MHTIKQPFLRLLNNLYLQIMKQYYPLLLSLVVILTNACTQEETPEMPAPVLLSTIEQEVLDAINTHRISLDKNILKHSDIAYEEALRHTEYMIAQNALSHDNFKDRSGNIIVSAKASAVSENVARFYESGEAVLQAWLSSSNGHRENLEGNYTFMAISARLDVENRYYFTAIFYK